MPEARLHELLCYGVIATAVAVFAALFFITAPYGRHARGGGARPLSTRAGGILREAPACLGFAAIYLCGRHAFEPAPLALFALWVIHYTHRAFIFPFRLKSAKRPMPLAVTTMAIVFNLINAYCNARWVSELGRYPTSWLRD